MSKKILAAFALALAPLLAACPLVEDDGSYYQVVGKIMPWTEDGPGGTTPTECPADSGQWQITIQKYRPRAGGGHPHTIGGPDIVCTDEASALYVAPGDRWTK